MTAKMVQDPCRIPRHSARHIQGLRPTGAVARGSLEALVTQSPNESPGLALTHGDGIVP